MVFIIIRFCKCICDYIFSYVFVALDHVVKDCSSCDVKVAPQPKRKPPEQEAATSTTPAEPSNISESPVASLSKIPVPEWGIEEVIQFIESTDPGLGVHADLFRKHVSLISSSINL